MCLHRIYFHMYNFSSVLRIFKFESNWFCELVKSLHLTHTKFREEGEAQIYRKIFFTDSKLFYIFLTFYFIYFKIHQNHPLLL